MNCSGDEAKLADCTHLGVNVVPNCVGLSGETDFYEAGVTCHGESDRTFIRLCFFKEKEYGIYIPDVQ